MTDELVRKSLEPRPDSRPVPFRSLHKAEVASLNQVLDVHAMVLVLLRYLRHKAQVGADKGVERINVAPSSQAPAPGPQ